MKNIIIKIIKTFIVLYLIAILFITIDGLTISDKNSNIKTKYIVVYGSKVKQNGVISDRLKARLNKAIEIFNLGKGEKIIVSGGLGKEGFKEGDVMKKYLVKKGIKIPRIIVDNNGNTTIETSKNSYKIIKDLGEYPDIGVIGVSQFFHLSRVDLSLKKAGFTHISTYAPDYYELRDIYSIIREVPAYIKYLFYFDF